MPTNPPVRNLALIVNRESDDSQAQLASGEEAVDGDGYAIETLVRAAGAPTGTDVRPGGTFWYATSTGYLYWSRGGGVWQRINVPLTGLWYNNATQSITTTTSTITIATVGFTNDGGALYSMTAGEVTIAVAGEYEIIYDITATSAGNNNRTRFWLETDGTTIAGTDTRTAGNASGFGACGTGRAIITAAAGDVIRVRGQVTGGANANTSAQGCRLQIKQLR